jgi:hypothetical protein
MFGCLNQDLLKYRDRMSLISCVKSPPHSPQHHVTQSHLTTASDLAPHPNAQTKASRVPTSRPHGWRKRWCPERRSPRDSPRSHGRHQHVCPSDREVHKRTEEREEELSAGGKKQRNNKFISWRKEVTY